MAAASPTSKTEPTPFIHRVLLIDADTDYCKELKAALKLPHIHVACLPTLAEAFAPTREVQFDLVIVGTKLPCTAPCLAAQEDSRAGCCAELNGRGRCTQPRACGSCSLYRLRRHPQFRNVPIIILSENDLTPAAVANLARRGASDILLKTCPVSRIRARVMLQLEKVRQGVSQSSPMTMARIERAIASTHTG